MWQRMRQISLQGPPLPPTGSKGVHGQAMGIYSSQCTLKQGNVEQFHIGTGPSQLNVKAELLHSMA